jgi:hypothetical protein
MAAYADARLLELWESGLVQHPLDRALTLLIAAEPGETRADLAALPVAALDERLLQVYQAAFGERLNCLAACPQCGAQLEFSLEAGRLAAAGAPTADKAMTLTQGGYTIQFRLPTSLDLAAAAAKPDGESAREELIAGCVVEARLGEVRVSPAELPEGLILALENSLAENDPQNERLLELVCAACGHAWQEPLDIAGFLWAQVAAKARRMLAEVHSLAGAYGWSEAEILGMSAQRRAAYMELIG